MRREWSLIIVLLFAIIVAVFAVINVDSVEVDYLFGTAQWPLVLIILGSALLGALTVGFAGSVRFFTMKKELKSLRRENQQLQDDSRQLQDTPQQHAVEKEPTRKQTQSESKSSIENTTS